MRKVKFMVCLLLLLIITPISAQDEEIPYIHYYSPLDNGIIIEQADGTDSRLISNLIDETHNSVVWYGWSPSGRWFALSSYHSTGEPANFGQYIQVVSTDGQKRIDLGMQTLDDFQMRWSPQNDIVLLVRKDQQGRGIRFQLFDVEQEHYLADTILQGFDFLRSLNVNLEWAEDGEKAYVSWNEFVITLHRNGFIETRTKSRGWQWRIGINFDNERILYPYRVFVNESIVLSLQEIDGERHIEIEDPFWGRLQYPYRIRWSPDLNYALVYARPCIDNACEAWLKLVNWETGEVGTITPALPVLEDNRDCVRYYGYECTEFWSPQGNYAIFKDEDRKFHILDVETGTVRSLGSDRRISYLSWTPDEQLFIQYKDDPDLYRYDPMTDHEEKINLPNLVVHRFGIHPSPGSEYIGLGSDPPTILDTNGNIVAKTIQHSHSSYASDYPVGYTWSADKNWVMANYSIVFAGGGGGPAASVLFDLAGTVRRELPTGGAAGFVPGRAIPYLAPGQATSLKKEPVFILPQAGYRVEGVGWHSTDPDQLVTYSVEDGLIFWSLAGDEPEIIEQITSIEFPFSFPTGMKLFWMPEQEIVAFDRNGGFFYVISDTGELAPVESVEVPTLVSDEDGHVFIFDPVDDTTIQLSTDLVVGTDQLVLRNSDNEGFIVLSGRDYSENAQYINSNTGAVTPLDVTSDLWTSDADNDIQIAAFGSIYNCCVTIVSIETGEIIDQFYGTAYSLALSADGKRLATTSAGMTAIWDMSEYLSDD